MSKPTLHKILILLLIIALFGGVLYLTTEPRHEVPTTKVNLSWKIPGATSCEASGGWEGAKPAQGTATATIDEPTSFTLTCTAAGFTRGQAKLSWTPPTANTDGSPLTDLAGYVISHGPTETDLGNPLVIEPTLVSYIVTGVPAGLRWFAIESFNSTDHHSSQVKASTTIPALPGVQNFKSTVSVYVSQQSTPPSEVSITFAGEPAEPVVESAILANLGGADLTDSNGNQWSADTCRNGTTAKIAAIDIKGTENDALYLDYRYGAGGEILCSYPVPTASHCNVNLITSEEYFTKDSGRGAAGKRIFGMALEGRTLVTGIDIFAEVGDHTSLVKTAATDVTDGQLDVTFPREIENPTVAALRITCLPL